MLRACLAALLCVSTEAHIMTVCSSQSEEQPGFVTLWFATYHSSHTDTTSVLNVVDPESGAHLSTTDFQSCETTSNNTNVDDIADVLQSSCSHIFLYLDGAHRQAFPNSSSVVCYQSGTTARIGEVRLGHDSLEVCYPERVLSSWHAAIVKVDNLGVHEVWIDGSPGNSAAPLAATWNSHESHMPCAMSRSVHWNLPFFADLNTRCSSPPAHLLDHVLPGYDCNNSYVGHVCSVECEPGYAIQGFLQCQNTNSTNETGEGEWSSSFACVPYASDVPDTRAPGVNYVCEEHNDLGNNATGNVSFQNYDSYHTECWHIECDKDVVISFSTMQLYTSSYLDLYTGKDSGNGTDFTLEKRFNNSDSPMDVVLNGSAFVQFRSNYYRGWSSLEFDYVCADATTQAPTPDTRAPGVNYVCEEHNDLGNNATGNVSFQNYDTYHTECWHIECDKDVVISFSNLQLYYYSYLDLYTGNDSGNGTDFTLEKSFGHFESPMDVVLNGSAFVQFRSNYYSGSRFELDYVCVDATTQAPPTDVPDTRAPGVNYACEKHHDLGDQTGNVSFQNDDNTHTECWHIKCDKDVGISFSTMQLNGFCHLDLYTGKDSGNGTDFTLEKSFSFSDRSPIVVVLNGSAFVQFRSDQIGGRSTLEFDYVCVDATTQAPPTDVPDPIPTAMPCTRDVVTVAQFTDKDNRQLPVPPSEETLFGGAVQVDMDVIINAYTNYGRFVDIGNGASSDNFIIGQYKNTGYLYVSSTWTAPKLRVILWKRLPLGETFHLRVICVPIDDATSTYYVYINDEFVIEGVSEALRYVTRSQVLIGVSSYTIGTIPHIDLNGSVTNCVMVMCPGDTPATNPPATNPPTQTPPTPVPSTPVPHTAAPTRAPGLGWVCNEYNDLGDNVTGHVSFESNNRGHIACWYIECDKDVVISFSTMQLYDGSAAWEYASLYLYVADGSGNGNFTSENSFFPSSSPRDVVLNGSALLEFIGPLWGNGGLSKLEFNYVCMDATQAPPTSVPPTQAPATQAPATPVPPTSVPPTQAPPTPVPSTPSAPAGVSVPCDRQNNLTGNGHVEYVSRQYPGHTQDHTECWYIACDTEAVLTFSVIWPSNAMTVYIYSSEDDTNFNLEYVWRSPATGFVGVDLVMNGSAFVQFESHPSSGAVGDIAFDYVCADATTQVPTTSVPPTQAPATQAPATPVPPTQAPPTSVPPPPQQQCGDTVPQRCGQGTSRACVFEVRHPARLLSVAFSWDGRRVVTGSADRFVRVFDARTGVRVGQLGCADGFRVHDIAFSPDNNLVALAGEGGRVVVCDAETGVLEATLVDMSASGSTPVHRVEFTRDGRYVVSGGGQDARTRVFDMLASDGTKASCVIEYHARNVGFSVDGAHLATVRGSEVDEVTTVWRLDGTSVAVELPSVSARVTALSFSSFGGNALLRGMSDGMILVSQLPGSSIGDGSAVDGVSLSMLSGAVHDSTFSRDGKMIAAVGEGDVMVWSHDGSVLHELLGHSQAVLPRLDFSPDGTRLATVSHDGTLVVWKL